MPFAAVSDLEMYYEVTGHGPERVLLISGTGADLRMARRGAATNPLARSFEVLEYDQRGLGQTSKPDRDYTMADYADDAVGLLDALGWDRVHVVGISFGGMVAQHVAIRHPDRVHKLVLACTSPGGAGGSSFDLLSLESLEGEAREQRAFSVLDSRSDFSTDPPTYAPGLEKIIPMMRSMRNADPDDPAKAMGARRQLVARQAHNAWDGLATVTAPTLCIGGRYDLQAPVENMRALAEQIPGARLVLCEGGHLFMLQDSSAYPTILEFLGARSAS
jgi:3-oxoadipate enol-lactonase